MKKTNVEIKETEKFVELTTQEMTEIKGGVAGDLLGTVF